MLPNPHPMIEVAIVGTTITEGTSAHRPLWAPDQSRADAAGAVPIWAVTMAAACNGAPAKTWSYAYTRSRGAIPCATCWEPA